MSSKKFVSIIAGVMVLCSVVTIIVYILQTGDVNVLSQSIRFILTCLLAYSLIKGSNIGRWFTIIFAGYTSVVLVILGITLIELFGNNRV